MAVSLIRRPEGCILNPTGITGAASDSGGNVLITTNSVHGLSSGDQVYIDSDVDNYNGFFLAEVTTTTAFLIYTKVDTENVAFIKTTSDLTVYVPDFVHGWSCVHLPIVYELSNNKYPVNSVDTTRTISSISNDNGLVNLNLSGSLGTFEDLSFVKISNCPDSDYDGVYQILDKLATNDVTINLDYTSTPASAITGATIQLYYSNFNIVVNVYAGINSSHEWTAQKPYELVGTLEFIPDESNRIRFSIHDLLKSYVETKNNTLLGTLPNNIDAWTQFYIEYAEQYDTSNGYTVSTLQSSFTSDQINFEGYAVNAILPFKNLYSGYLSEYLMTNNTAKFLTLFTIPVLFSCSDDTPDCYTDISFINPYDDTEITIKKEFYSDNVLQSTVETSLGTLDSGVIRAELEADCGYDRVDITLLGSDLQILENPSFDEPSESLAPWTNVGSGIDWTNPSTFAQAIVTSGSPNSKELSQTFSTADGNFELVMRTFVNTGSVTFTVTSYMDGVMVEVITSFLCNWANPDANVQTVNFTAVGEFNEIRIEADRVTGASVNANVASIFLTDEESIVSETKRFDIDCGCSNQEIRLTWLNNLGGFDYWAFTGQSDHTVDISQSGETKQNIFPEWPKSYGEFSDTIRKQTFRESSNRKFIFSQHLTQDQADALAYIKSSPLVQIINSRKDKRTVLVDTDSFSKYADGDKTFTISFSILYTDNIPSQTV